MYNLEPPYVFSDAYNDQGITQVDLNNIPLQGPSDLLMWLHKELSEDNTRETSDKMQIHLHAVPLTNKRLRLEAFYLAYKKTDRAISFVYDTASKTTTITSIAKSEIPTQEQLQAEHNKTKANDTRKNVIISPEEAELIRNLDQERLQQTVNQIVIVTRLLSERKVKEAILAGQDLFPNNFVCEEIDPEDGTVSIYVDKYPIMEALRRLERDLDSEFGQQHTQDKLAATTFNSYAYSPDLSEEATSEEIVNRLTKDGWLGEPTFPFSCKWTGPTDMAPDLDMDYGNATMYGEDAHVDMFLNYMPDDLFTQTVVQMANTNTKEMWEFSTEGETDFYYQVPIKDHTHVIVDVLESHGHDATALKQFLSNINKPYPMQIPEERQDNMEPKMPIKIIVPVFRRAAHALTRIWQAIVYKDEASGEDCWEFNNYLLQTQKAGTKR